MDGLGLGLEETLQYLGQQQPTLAEFEQWAGDLIIWHKALPHGSRPNSAKRPRIVQYLSMYPTKGERQAWK